MFNRKLGNEVSTLGDAVAKLIIANKELKDRLINLEEELDLAYVPDGFDGGYHLKDNRYGDVLSGLVDKRECCQSECQKDKKQES